MRHPPPATATSPRHVEAVDALDREVLVVAEDRRHGRAELAGGEHVPQGAEHRREAQHQADLGGHPGAGHGGGERLRAGQVGGERLLAEHRARRRATAASTTARCAAVGVHTHTASQRSSTVGRRSPPTSAPFTAAKPCGALGVEVVDRHHGGVDHPGPDHGLEADGMGPGDHPCPHEPDSRHGPANYVARDGP